MQDQDQSSNGPETGTPGDENQQTSQNAASGTAPAPAAVARAPRKPRSDKGQAKPRGKAKPRAKAVRLPVQKMLAQVELADGSATTHALKAMTATAAVAEVLKLASAQENAEKMAGAKVGIVAVVDVFTIASDIQVSVKAKR